MICPACRNKQHTECRGGTWCACQHRPQVPEPVHQRDKSPLEKYSALGFLYPPKDLADVILSEFGRQEIMDLGTRSIPDWLWQVCAGYRKLSADEQLIVDAVVAAELYG